MSYLVYDLVPKHVLDGWTVIGELVVLLWHTCIEDVKEYLVSLPILSSFLESTYFQQKLTHTINNSLSISALCAPSILVTKAKFHFLVHLPDYIRQFGPAILFSTEHYESFNHVFQLSSIHSNWQAPSHDTCQSFADQDIVKHIVTGGYWYDERVKRWVHAGKDITTYLDAHPEVCQLLGLPRSSEKPIGESSLAIYTYSNNKLTTYQAMHSYQQLQVNKENTTRLPYLFSGRQHYLLALVCL